MADLPERIEGQGVLLRRWRISDAEHLGEAITESADHLRPWMAWMADEPQTLAQRRELLARWEREWDEAGDAHYALVANERVAGSCGLHRRLGFDALEIGFWVHAGFVRCGLATEAAALLTAAAFALPEIEHVEIHHDKANVASSGVPRRLGYGLVCEQRDPPTAPADTGIECVWRIDRGEWITRSDALHERPWPQLRYESSNPAASSSLPGIRCPYRSS